MVISLFVLIRKKKKALKLGAVFVAALLVFQIGIINVVFPYFNITQGSKREMLSVPFVQTARYITEYKDEITAEEEAAILQVMTNGGTLDEIADAYEVTLETKYADNVKNRYNKNATSQDLKNYISVWLKEMKKHPTVYVQAFFNLHYGWISFEGNDFKSYQNSYYDNLTELMPGFNNYSGNKTYRSLVDLEINTLNSIPLTKPIFEISTYTWLYLFLLIYSLANKRFKAFAVNTIVFANYLIYFAGPIAYMRYVVPMICVAPFSVFITACEDEERNNG